MNPYALWLIVTLPVILILRYLVLGPSADLALGIAALVVIVAPMCVSAMCALVSLLRARYLEVAALRGRHGLTAYVGPEAPTFVDEVSK